MKVAFDALNVKRGGGLTVLTRLVRAFLEARHQVQVVTSSVAVARNVKEETGIEAHEIPSAWSALGAQLFRHRHWSEMMRQIEAESVFGFNYWTPTRLPQVTYHINVIPFLSFNERRQVVGLERALLQAHYSKLALRRSTLNLFESEHILALASATSREIANPVVRYIGIDIPRDSGSPQPSLRRIVAVTSSARHKHNEYLFALHRALHPYGIGLRLIGVTRDVMDTTEEMRAERDYALAQSNIAFLGYCSRAQLYDELRVALALVSFSELEAFFMVPIEAMSVGCPAIVTDMSSARESVGNAGLLIPPNGVESAAQHIIALLDPARRDAISKLSRAWSARFDAELCARDIVNAVGEALA